MITAAAVTKPRLFVEDWKLVDYAEACEQQTLMVRAHLSGTGRDTLVLTEHPPTVTLGRRGSSADLRCAESAFSDNGVSLHHINRGGLATAHEPGQLVVYPILALPVKDLHHFSQGFLKAVIELLADYGLRGELKPGNPGVWVSGRKICSFGIALKRWVVSHGIALNLNNDLKTFELIVPCGVPTEKVTSLRKELGQSVDADRIKKQLVSNFCKSFGYEPVPVQSQT